MKMIKMSLIGTALVAGSFGQEQIPQADLQSLVERSVKDAIQEFKSESLKEEELAVTAVILGEGTNVVRASYRGDVRIYPASVIKMFYLEAVHRWMEDGRLADTPELRRAMKDMIVDSYNEATHYVVDLLTGTTSGPELPEKEMAEWKWKRNAVNRYFTSRGFENINCNQKPWCEGPYGRERNFVGLNYTNRNGLTTDATARLLTEIAQGAAVSKARSAQMLELMARNHAAPSGDTDSQARGFTAPALPADAKLWSKAGWTSQTRHDAALVQLSNGTKIVLVIFTVNHASNRKIIPAIAKPILEPLNQRN